MKKIFTTLAALALLASVERIYSVYDHLYGVRVDAFELGLIEGSVKELNRAIAEYHRHNGDLPSNLGQMFPDYINNSFQIFPSRLRGRLGMESLDLEQNFFAIDLVGVWRIVGRNKGKYILIGDWRLLGMNNVPICVVTHDVISLSFLPLSNIDRAEIK